MLIIIVISLVYKNKRKFKIHAELMGIAVILHLISFFAVMLPSFNNSYDYFVTANSDLGVQTMWIHMVPGAFSMILGIFLVAAWVLNPTNIVACSKRKRLMDITTFLWSMSLIFGIISYIIYYI